MNLSDLPDEIDFLFTTIGQATVSAAKRGHDKEFFMKFCQGMWETMELNGLDKFSKILTDKMAHDINKRMGTGSYDSLLKKANKKI
jgi:hypothetical protein